MEKSTHKVEVVRISNIEKHPNADKLEVCKVFGYSVCVGIGEFKDGDLGVYLPPDSVVPEKDEFKWVWEAKGYFPPPPNIGSVSGKEYPLGVPEKYRRIKAKTLRGVVSEGLLIHLPNHIVAVEGQDVAEVLGITHYNPPELDGDSEIAPINPIRKKKKRYPRTLKGWLKLIWFKFFPRQTIQGHEDLNTGLTIPTYDIDSWQRYGSILIPGEEVWITEKIHGSNCRFTYISDPTTDYYDGRMYVGSHYQWKKDVPSSAFWQGMRQNPWIESFCRQNPGLVLYGELVPTQKKMKYGQESGNYRVFGFDIYDPTLHKWLSKKELEALNFEIGYWEGTNRVFRKLLDEVHWVPTVAISPYNEDDIRQLADGSSLVKGANHIREGIVIKPVEERQAPHFGRVILKIVGTKYLESKSSE